MERTITGHEKRSLLSSPLGFLRPGRHRPFPVAILSSLRQLYIRYLSALLVADNRPEEMEFPL